MILSRSSWDGGRGVAEECQTSINQLHVKIFKESLSPKNTGLKAKTNLQV